MPRHRIVTRLISLLALVLGLLASVAATATPAQALDDRGECWMWAQHGWEDKLANGESIYVIEAWCVGWTTPSDQWWVYPQDGEDLPGPIGREDKDYCDVVRSQLSDLQRDLAQAQAQLQAARADVAQLQPRANADYVALQTARANLDAATRALETARATYARTYDVSAERELRNGHVVTVQTGVDLSTPEGRAVIAAQSRVTSAEAAVSQAWTQWSARSGPALQAAQQRLIHIESTIATAPSRMAAIKEELRRAKCR